jgi:hypothetical protein
MTTVQLNASDAAELAEMLTLIGSWLTSDPATLTGSLEKFTGGTAYTTGTLRDDLARFTFLLGHDDGEQLFGEQQPWPTRNGDARQRRAADRGAK